MSCTGYCAAVPYPKRSAICLCRVVYQQRNATPKLAHNLDHDTTKSGAYQTPGMSLYGTILQYASPCLPYLAWQRASMRYVRSTRRAVRYMK